MTMIMVNPDGQSTGASIEIIQPLWVRITHWINAIAMVLMMTSGWQIYNASPLFGFTFPPQITLGGWLAGALLWHFAAMWLLVVNGLVYLTIGLLTGHFRRRLFPISMRELFGDIRDALTFRLSHADLSVYNAAQKFLYLGVIVAGILVALSGLSMWKPVQLQTLTAMFGGYDTGRCVHFLAMAAIACFLLIHVILAVLVPRSLRAMITGR